MLCGNGGCSSASVVHFARLHMDLRPEVSPVEGRVVSSCQREGRGLSLLGLLPSEKCMMAVTGICSGNLQGL